VTWPDARFPADPYPGAVPGTSFVHADGFSYLLRHIGGWDVDGVGLDAWLEERGAEPLDRRVPVLAYGSNRCPSKITWLRAELGLGADPVVVLRAMTRGVAAVWAAGLRARDGQRPAVLAAAPGVVEEHAVWMATRDQVAVLDVCEGRDQRFRLVRLHTGEVRTEDGVLVEAPWCYTGAAEQRRPLLVGGAPVRCAEVGQAGALALVGEPAAGDGLDVTTVAGAPDPDDWPPALFTYGLLRPGQVSWDLVAPHAAGPPTPATVPGSVHDTGQGYPAWLPDGPGTTPGVLVPLRDPAAAFPGLDAYEGPEYQRVRVVTTERRACWAYAWTADRAGLRPR
jgi:gamma-glutamylcyclotransferase (GGCT)/AIG2-like uncharacterized protein YtfP